MPLPFHFPGSSLPQPLRTCFSWWPEVTMRMGLERQEGPSGRGSSLCAELWLGHWEGIWAQNIPALVLLIRGRWRRTMMSLVGGRGPLGNAGGKWRFSWLVCLEERDTYAWEPSTSAKIDACKRGKKAAEFLLLSNHVGLGCEWVGRYWSNNETLSNVLQGRPPSLSRMPGRDRPPIHWASQAGRIGVGALSQN